jgi:hypothetical protein
MNDMLSPTIPSNQERFGLAKGTHIGALHKVPIYPNQQVKDRADKLE